MGRAREKSRYPCGSREWALSVLHGVVSSVLSSSVVLCWSQCDWLQLGSRCDSSTGSVGSPSASVGSVFFLKYVVLEAMDSPEKEKKKKTQYGMDKGFDVVGLQSTGVRHLLYREMSVWVDAVSSLGVSLHLVLVRALACCHVSVAFFFSPQNGRAGGEGGRPGAKCSSVPRTRHPRKCALSSWLLCWDAGMRNGWYQSYRSSC